MFGVHFVTQKYSTFWCLGEVLFDLGLVLFEMRCSTFSVGNMLYNRI